MSALPYPIYGISNLYLFPVYQTREAYQKATGKEAPLYDASKPVKSWFDPKAAENPRRKLVYDSVLALADNGQVLADTDGKPLLEPLLIDREQAAAVNIPPKGPGILDAPQTGIEIPVPLRPLEAKEELCFQFGGVVAVRNKDLFPKLEVAFTAEDRELLRAIARKLGI
jgi:hypothetical protein